MVTKLTCDMSNVEFAAYVQEKCGLTLANTNAGVYMQGLIDRLLVATKELENAKDTLHSVYRVMQDAGFAKCGHQLAKEFADSIGE